MVTPSLVLLTQNARKRVEPSIRLRVRSLQRLGVNPLIPCKGQGRVKHACDKKDLTAPAQGRSRAYICATKDFGSSLSQCPWRHEWQVPRTNLNQINASRVWQSDRDESWPECSHCGPKLSLCKAGYGNAPHCDRLSCPQYLQPVGTSHPPRIKFWPKHHPKGECVLIFVQDTIETNG